MTGYQEILSDPSYHRQMVVFSHPEIGNYGVHDPWSEHVADRKGLGAKAAIVNRLSTYVVPGREAFLPWWLDREGAILSEVDTRSLIQKIRRDGAQNAVLASERVSLAEARRVLDQSPEMNGANLAAEVSISVPVHHGEGSFRVALVDFGVKQSILEALRSRSCSVLQLPWNCSFEDIRAFNPHGVLLSNGPGDPAAVREAIEIIPEVLSAYPTFGICLGFQLMALAVGGKTYKLPFGHRGGNHPVGLPEGGGVKITAQNHGFAVQADSLPRDVRPTLISLFDGTLEGLEGLDAPFFGVQFHPEAGPGPHDAMDLFDHFVQEMQRHAAK
jgi:carbamoyl-phosphate synthase small subunit